MWAQRSGTGARCGGALCMKAQQSTQISILLLNTMIFISPHPWGPPNLVRITWLGSGFNFHDNGAYPNDVIQDDNKIKD